MVTVDALAEQPDSAGGPRRVGTYVVPNDWDGARRRLRLLEAWADPATTRRLAVTGVGPGWHCLEVGAGGGSITDWLCQQVGSTGTVVAVDIDTRFVDELEHPNLAVRHQDVVTEPVPRHQFDLVHTRAVLSHLPARHEVLADLIAALRPGGWLLIEEVDFFPVHACGTGLYRDTIIALEDILSPAGLNCHWARGLAPLLQDGGLGAVTAAADVGFCPGGSPAAQFLAVSLEQLRDPLIAGGCTAADLDRFALLMDDPTVWFPNMALVGAAGQRPR
jgi:SAM-dependent methyltransferase